MYNEELLNKIIDTYGMEKSIQFCEIVATMYDIKYNACKEINPLTEYDFERTWWNEAYIELKQDIKI